MFHTSVKEVQQVCPTGTPALAGPSAAQHDAPVILPWVRSLDGQQMSLTLYRSKSSPVWHSPSVKIWEQHTLTSEVTQSAASARGSGRWGQVYVRSQEGEEDMHRVIASRISVLS